MLGPKTRASLKLATTDIMYRTINLGLGDEGLGETEGNNRGRWIRKLRAFCGFPVDAVGPWCGVWASAKIKHAYSSFGLEVPFELSRGAYRLVKNVGEYGRIIDLNNPEPGVYCWQRRGWFKRRSAHVRFVIRYDKVTDTMYYVAGNEGGKVRRGRLKGEEWRKGIIGGATF